MCLSTNNTVARLLCRLVHRRFSYTETCSRPTVVKLTVLTVACPVQIRWKHVLSVRHAFHVCFICSLSVTLAVTYPVLLRTYAAIVRPLCCHCAFYQFNTPFVRARPPT